MSRHRPSPAPPGCTDRCANQKKHAAGTSNSKCPLPGPVPGIHVLAAGITKVQEDVDAHGSSPWAEGPRVKPGQGIFGFVYGALQTTDFPQPDSRGAQRGEPMTVILDDE